ncbi:MAG: family 1 encapsulin nanocompartment shell protein [Candidatus Brocadiia bacterium]|jgi:uncharacterized linocin/CFP29 family protein
MATELLNRGDAPFSDKVWAAIDAAVVGAAKSQLGARRVLPVEGPYGLGLKSLPVRDAPAAEQLTPGSAIMTGAVPPPVVNIASGFRLAARDIAAFEERGMLLDLGEAARAAISVAFQEDALLFNGAKDFGVEGLLTAKGVHSAKLKDWAQVGTAATDIIEAVTKLDAAGFHGPYALALAPDRYNLLLRRYPQGAGTELEHLRLIASEGVSKAAAIRAGGVLLAWGVQYSSIVLGQDLMAGFVGPAGRDYELTVSESLALRLLQPASVVALK